MIGNCSNLPLKNPQAWCNKVFKTSCQNRIVFYCQCESAPLISCGRLKRHSLWWKVESLAELWDFLVKPSMWASLWFMSCLREWERPTLIVPAVITAVTSEPFNKVQFIYFCSDSSGLPRIAIWLLMKTEKSYFGVRVDIWSSLVPSKRSRLIIHLLSSHSG